MTKLLQKGKSTKNEILTARIETMTKKAIPIKLSLLENGENFAAEGIKAAIRAENNPKDWKFAILHIVQALELVLKEILRREHKMFIYEDIDKSTKTVSLLQAFARIEKISGNKFSAKDHDKIKRAVDFRNRFTHSNVEYNSMQMKAVFTEMFGFLQHCYDSFFDKHISQAIDSSLWVELTKIEGYVKKLYDQFRDKVNKDDIKENNVFICHLCRHDSFLLRESECYVCGHNEPKRKCKMCGEHIIRSRDYYIYGNNNYCVPCANDVDIQDYAYKVDLGFERFLNGEMDAE